MVKNILFLMTILLIPFSVSAGEICKNYYVSRTWACLPLACGTCGYGWVDCYYNSKSSSPPPGCLRLPHGYNPENKCSSISPNSILYNYQECTFVDDSNNTCPNVNVTINGLPGQRIRARLTCNQ